MSMDRTDLDRARELFVKTARDLESAATLTAGQLRAHLRGAAHAILDMLENDEDGSDDEDVMTTLDRQSKSIADDLRRVERLMRHMQSQDD